MGGGGVFRFLNSSTIVMSIYCTAGEVQGSIREMCLPKPTNELNVL
jgi:hypothetical protein